MAEFTPPAPPPSAEATAQEPRVTPVQIQSFLQDSGSMGEGTSFKGQLPPLPDQQSAQSAERHSQQQAMKSLIEEKVLVSKDVVWIAIHVQFTVMWDVVTTVENGKQRPNFFAVAPDAAVLAQRLKVIQDYYVELLQAHSSFESSSVECTTIFHLLMLIRDLVISAALYFLEFGIQEEDFDSHYSSQSTPQENQLRKKGLMVRLKQKMSQYANKKHQPVYRSAEYGIDRFQYMLTRCDVILDKIFALPPAVTAAMSKTAKGREVCYDLLDQGYNSDVDVE